MLLYDTTNQESYDLVRSWLPNVNIFSKTSNFCTCILGTKSDLISQRVVSYDQGKQLADTYCTKFAEISSKANHNLELAFSSMIKDIEYGRFKNSVSKYPSILHINYI